MSAQDLAKALVKQAEAIAATSELTPLVMFKASVARALAPDLTAASRMVGLCALKAGFYRFARTLLQDILQQDPDDDHATLLLARAHAELANYDEALMALEAREAPSSLFVDWTELQADLLVRSGRGQDAADLLQNELGKVPAATRLQLRLFEVLERLGQGDKALSWLDLALSAGDEAVAANRILIHHLFRSGDSKAALAAMTHFRDHVAGRLQSCKPLLPREDVAWEPAMLRDMRDNLDQALAIAPDVPALLEMSARLMILDGAEDGAFELLSRQGDALSAAARSDLALLALARGQIPPVSPPAGICRDLSVILTQRHSTFRGDVDLAFAACRRMVSRILDCGRDLMVFWLGRGHSEDPMHHWVLAYFQYASGLTQEALEHHAQFSVRAVDTASMDQCLAHVALCRLAEECNREEDVARLWDQFLGVDCNLVMVISKTFTVLGHYSGKGETLAAAILRHCDRLPALSKERADGGVLWSSALLAMAFLDGDDSHYDHVLAGMSAYFRDELGTFDAPVPAQPCDGRYRIGYVMSDFQHQDLPLEQYAIRFHDLSRFDVTVYTFTPEVRAHVRPCRDRPPTLRDWPGTVRSIDRMPAEHAARMVAADGLDLLVDTVGWWAEEIPRLFLRRPVPLQVTWLGLGRPGLDVMDYIVGTETLFGRDLDGRYPEAFIRFSGNYIPPKPLPEHVAVTPRSLLGLPEGAFIFLGYHQVMKVTQRSLELWMEILRRTPGSHLILPPMDERVILRMAQAAGVEPSRLHIFSWVETEFENLSRIGVADLYLDTIPFNSAGLTGYDAIAMNVPRLSLRGANLYGRFGHVLSAALGLEDLVITDPRDYVEMAVRLHDDPALLADIRARMRVARMQSPAMKPQVLMDAVESAWSRIIDRQRQGLPPQGFDV